MRLFFALLFLLLLSGCASFMDGWNSASECPKSMGSQARASCKKAYIASEREKRAKDEAFQRQVDDAWEKFNKEVTIDRALAPLKTTCKSMGFTEGSDPFANCVLQLQRQQAAAAQQQNAVNAARIRQQGQDITDTFNDYARARQQIQRPAPAINCTTTTVGNTSNTSCR